MIYPRRKTARNDAIRFWIETDEQSRGTEDLQPVLDRLGLTEKQSEAIKLKVEGLTERDIAIRLGITLKSAQERIRYGKKKLEALRHPSGSN